MYRSTFLDLGTSCRWVVCFMPQPLYPRGKSPRYPLDRRLGGPQNRSGWHGEEKILAPTGTPTPNLLSSSLMISNFIINMTYYILIILRKTVQMTDIQIFYHKALIQKICLQGPNERELWPQKPQDTSLSYISYHHHVFQWLLTDTVTDSE
jgi:hypothetical protein